MHTVARPGFLVTLNFTRASVRLVVLERFALLPLAVLALSFALLEFVHPLAPVVWLGVAMLTPSAEALALGGGALAPPPVLVRRLLAPCTSRIHTPTMAAVSAYVPFARLMLVVED